RTAARATRSAAATSVANNVSRPAEGSSAKAMMFSSVVLPAPAAPVRKQKSPASSVSEISDRTAAPAPSLLPMPSSVTTAILAASQPRSPADLYMPPPSPSSWAPPDARDRPREPATAPARRRCSDYPLNPGTYPALWLCSCRRFGGQTDAVRWGWSRFGRARRQDRQGDRPSRHAGQVVQRDSQNA